MKNFKTYYESVNQYKQGVRIDVQQQTNIINISHVGIPYNWATEYIVHLPAVSIYRFTRNINSEEIYMKLFDMASKQHSILNALLGSIGVDITTTGKIWSNVFGKLLTSRPKGMTMSLYFPPNIDLSNFGEVEQYKFDQDAKPIEIDNQLFTKYQTKKR